MPDWSDDKTPVSRQQLLDIERRCVETQTTANETKEQVSKTAILLAHHVDRDEAVNASNAQANAINTVEIKAIHMVLAGTESRSKEQSQKLEAIREDVGGLSVTMGKIEGALGVLVSESETNRKLAVLRAETDAEVAVVRARGEVGERKMRIDTDKVEIMQRTKISLKLIALVLALITTVGGVVTIVVRGIYAS